MLVKVVAVQAQMGQPLTLEEKLYIFREQPEFVCLPEYYLLDETVEDYHRAALRQSEYLQYLQRLSDELGTCLIAGTVVEPDGDKLFNTCYVIDHGTIVGGYRKRNPVPGERAKGISPGPKPLVLEFEDVRVGVLICGDVFEPSLYSELGHLEVDIVFIPTTSAFRPADSLSRKAHRDEIYFRSGAELAGAYVVKTCGVGSIFGHPLQGRSLIAAPWGMLSRVQALSEQEKRLLRETLDIAELRDFKSKYRLAEKSDPEKAKGDIGSHLTSS